MTRTSIGKTAVASDNISFSQDITGIHPDETHLSAPYLKRYLDAKRGFLAAKGRGATIKGVSRQDVAGLPVYVPSLNKQQRIVEILDAADALRTKCRRVVATVETLVGAWFQSLFGDPVVNSMSWDERSVISDLAEVAGGITKGRKIRSSVKLTEVPFLAVVNVQDGRLDLENVKSINASKEEIDRHQLLVDDLLLTEGGDPDKLGRGTLWRGELPLCVHQNHVFRIRVLEKGRILPGFLMALISSGRGRRYFRRAAKQTTGIASINKTQLSEFPLLLPPIELQYVFVAGITSVEYLERKCAERLAMAEALFDSLQATIFEGGH